MLIDTRTSLPSDSYKSPLKPASVAARDNRCADSPHNPFEEMTTIIKHDGMWIVSIYDRLTVIADPDRDNAIARAVRQHSKEILNLERALYLSEKQLFRDTYGEPHPEYDNYL